jgi:hypothetical protein
MTVLYIIGGLLSATMWLGLIYVLVVEPIRLHLRRREAPATEHRSVSLPLGRLSFSGGSHRALKHRPRT